jgi:hypothetical protein
MHEHIALLRDALRTKLAEVAGEFQDVEGDPAILRMGDDAFDWIMGEVRGGELTPQEVLRGLNLLTKLALYQCFERRGQLFDLALELAQSRAVPPDVRSHAAHIVASSPDIARGLRGNAFGRSREQVQAEAVQAVRHALEIGLTPKGEETARDFLARVAHWQRNPAVYARLDQVQSLFFNAIAPSTEEASFPLVTDETTLLDVGDASPEEILERLARRYGKKLENRELHLPLWQLVDRLGAEK